MANYTIYSGTTPTGQAQSLVDAYSHVRDGARARPKVIHTAQRGDGDVVLRCHVDTNGKTRMWVR